MRKLTATICLTIAVLLGSVGICKSAEYKKRFTAYKNGDDANAQRPWKPSTKLADVASRYNLDVTHTIQTKSLRWHYHLTRSFRYKRRYQTISVCLRQIPKIYVGREASRTHKVA